MGEGHTKRDDFQSGWLEDKRSQAVLRLRHAAAFEFDTATGRQAHSPDIGEYVAGNYDGRLLSQVMLEDGVIHPDDITLSLAFREKIKSGKAGHMTLRLLTPRGDYHWFQMSMSPCGSVSPGLFVGVLADVDEEVRQEKILRYRAEFDAVSRIYNQSSFYEKTRALLESEREQPHYLLRFDIDRFKLVNELYSISEGDLVLRHVGQALQSLARPGETYARMGNDVFCACLCREEPQILQFICDLEERVNQYPLSFHFVLSVGILQIPRYDGQPVNILCDRAAMAQREIKGNYIRRYAFYTPAMSQALNREHYITGCMHRALEDGQFQIYLQPKFDIQNNQITGAEALARWFHPVDGMIPPGEFIPLFERNGFILRLDEYIWELACQVMRRWMDQGFRLFPISVNVSRIHLHDPDFCSKITALVEKYRVPSRLLELEITESAYTDSPQVLYKIMDKLQSQGFQFAMDDFGSGYSSLNMLKDIPVNIVKIDLNFLRDARRGKEAGRGILKGTVQMVRGIHLPVIAEGVETKEQADFLLSIGCTQAQGYYCARPMPVPEFEAVYFQ